MHFMNGGSTFDGSLSSARSGDAIGFLEHRPRERSRTDWGGEGPGDRESKINTEGVNKIWGNLTSNIRKV